MISTEEKTFEQSQKGISKERILLKIKNKIKRHPDFVRASDEESCGDKS